MSTLDQLQKKLDDKTLNPDSLNEEQRMVIDALIKSGKLKGPTMGELSEMRLGAAQEVAKEKEFLQDPLQVSTGVGQDTYELVGDIGGSIYPYVANRKKIFKAAKEGTLLGKGPGFFAQQAAKVADRLPGRFKLLGGALKVLAKEDT